jgi:predicted extracellular nuclease
MTMPDASNMSFAANLPAGAARINEIRPNPEGFDPATQQLEIAGMPGAAFSGVLFSIESDAVGSVNQIQQKETLSGSFDADGLLTVTIPDLENPSFTLVLTDDTATASVGDSIDPAAPAGLGAILDAIGVADNATDVVVGAALGGTDIAYTGDEPKLVFRDGGTGDLYAVNDPDGGDVYDAVGNVVDPSEFGIDPLVGDTFGSVNPTLGGTSPDDGDEGDGGDDTPLTPIYAIQGAAHVSPMVGQAVVTSGIIIATDSNGFFVQEPDGDGDIATSDALFVFTGGAPGVSAGDSVEIAGTVSEFTPGGTGTGNLSTTQIANPDSVTVLSQNNALPSSQILGKGGHVPVDAVIDDDSFASFDPTEDGIDFFESLEAMLVTAQDMLAVSGTNGFGEIFGVVDQGADASGLSVRGTLNIAPDDFNPERIQIDSDGDILPGFAFPQVTTGDQLGDVTGVVTYDFGNFQINPTEAFTVTPQELAPETTTLSGDADKMTVASYNVLNLDPVVEEPGNLLPGVSGGVDDDEGDGRFDAIAAQIVGNMNAPDVIGLQEIQDNTGAEGVDSVTSGADTLQKLVDAIAVAGGPSYSFVDNTFIGDDTSGGIPGGNIRTAFLYNDARASLDPASVQTIGSQAAGEAFEGARLPLVADFTFNGETVTVVNNHFSSKGGSAPIFGTSQPFDQLQEDPSVNGSLDERQAQSAAVQEFLSARLAIDPDAKLVALGDLNEFEFVSPVTGLEAVLNANGVGVNNLTEALPEDERYSFNFQGNSQSLDHILVSDSLASSAEIDIVHVNSEFSDSAGRASDHDPVVAALDIPAAEQLFTLELLHITDQEASTGSIGDFVRASGVLNALEAQDLGDDGLADNTVRLSSGDAIIPGVFYDAAEAVFGSGGIADIQLVNEMGFQAVALGNHEFDKGTAELAALIDGLAPGDFSALNGTALDGLDFSGAEFAYLGTNLDFSTDGNLAPLEVPGGAAPLPNSVTSSTVIHVNGEQLGVIGAVTPNLASISSTGDLGIGLAWADGTPTDAELDALAAEIQTEVDALLADNAGLNKVVLLAHMQEISIEQGLATRLENVDIIVAGGSNTRLFDEDDYIRPGDSDQGTYPQFFENAGGTQTILVNTDGSYKYVGRLVIDFDADGNIIAESYDETISGAYATDETGLANIEGADDIDPEVQAITDAIQEEILASEGNVFGVSNVFLNGNRSGTDDPSDPDGVRTQETNLGNLTADANLAAAQAVESDVLVSIKNGGGIRASIGETVVPAGGSDFVRQPNGEILDGDGNVVKPTGGVSQNDISTTLAFNNALSLLTLTHENLIEVLEHGLEGLPGVAGGFPQVSGVQFSFDDEQPAGSRIVNAAITDADGNDIAVLMRDGEVVTPDAEVRVVTLNFLADGGDGYPFPMGEAVNRVDLADLDGDGEDDGSQTGAATFADDGTEQDALAEYLAANFAAEDDTFDMADTGRDQDTRIQNLDFREDTVIDAPEMIMVEGTDGRDRLVGTDADEIIISGEGRYDTQSGGLGADVFVFGAETQNGIRERDIITDYEVGIDVIGLAEGTTVADIRATSSSAVVYFNDSTGAQDALYVRGDGVTADNLTFETFETFAFA